MQEPLETRPINHCIASQRPVGIAVSLSTERGNVSVQSDTTRSQEMACCDTKYSVSEGGETYKIITKFAKSRTFVHGGPSSAEQFGSCGK